MSKKWRIKKEQIYIYPEFSSLMWQPGHMSRLGWSLYYGTIRVARYTTWARCCEHIETAHRRFGL